MTNTQAATSTTVDTAFTGEASVDLCKLIQQVTNDTDQIAPALDDAGALRALFQKLSDDIRSAAAIAPDEIRPDIRMLSDAYATALAGLEQVNFDFSRASPSTFTALSSDSVQAATARLTAYSTEICGTH